MKLFLFLTFVSLTFSALAEEYVDLHYSPTCILEAVMTHRNKKRDPKILLPELLPSSTTPFGEYLKFAKTIFPEGFEITTYNNFYSLKTNKIYINNSVASANARGRTPDDILAHELTHYIQFTYDGMTESESTMDEPETEATYVQTWFRESFMKPGFPVTPCPEAQAKDLETSKLWKW